jgi:23S rRNA (guanine2445-N2)-methyltransferase / 23S rRNA (guanine2069-N7)-methyltransferase
VLWNRLRQEALELANEHTVREPLCFGSDVDARSVAIAETSARLAGVSQWVRFEHKPLSAIRAPAPRGLVITNPPYGERIGERERLEELYTELGEVLRARFEGWQAAILTSEPSLGKRVGIRAHRAHNLFNGPIEAQLLRMKIEPDQFFQERIPGRLPPIKADWALKPGAVMFGNRLKKNRDNLSKWARRQGVSCFRVYDADMPEYAFAIDEYADSSAPEVRYVFVQEYMAPSSISEEAVKSRRLEALSRIPEVMEVPSERIWFRTRKRQRGSDQYQKVKTDGEYYQISEGGHHFWVNFDEFQDTGIFLDHRMTRARIETLSSEQRFLNLFAYTGSASVYAAAGGAQSVTTVDMSRTYLDWARRNMQANGFEGRQYVYIQADALQWLESAPAAGWDLIFLDPPTFSNSKRMQDTLDVQRDQVRLISHTLRLLAPGGRLIFSTNFTKFQLDQSLLQQAQVVDLSKETIPKDFERNPRIHRCFEFTV